MEVKGQSAIAPNWITDTTMAYASYARGFKSGGINMSGLPLDSNNRPVLATAVVRRERNETY
ncbi:hypothetical protein [Sphingomonas sp. Marseille-Q8236]